MSDTAVYENVTEIDGPPRAYFEIPIVDDEGRHYTLRIVYQTFELRAPATMQDALEVAGATLVDKIRARLQTVGGGMIWWRRRPMPAESEDKKTLSWSCRLQTSPELSKEFLDTLGSPDYALENPARRTATLR